MKIEKLNLKLNILTLYRNNRTAIENFLVNMREILTVHTIHVIIGDFNINLLHSAQCSGRILLQLMESFNFCQTVSSPTFVPAGTLLDHIYVNTRDIPLSQSATKLRSVYYSDHEAVILSISRTLRI